MHGVYLHLFTRSIYTHTRTSNQCKTHFSTQLNCWSIRCNWSIACRRCSNYIFILDLTPGFNILRKDNWKPRRKAFKVWDLVRLTSEILRQINSVVKPMVPCLPWGGISVICCWEMNIHRISSWPQHFRHDHFSFHVLTLIPTWIGNHMSDIIWDGITYPFPNFNGCSVEVCWWISNFISHPIMDVVTYPCQ